MEAQNKTASVSGTRTDEETVKLFLLLMDAQSWSKGARRLEIALLYLLREEQPEDHMVKELYAEVASRTNCTWVAAERSLRYTIRKLWDSHPNLCSRLFYRSKERLECPPVSMFLILFYTANKRGTIREWVELSEAQSLSIYPRIGNIIFSFMIKPSVLFDWKQYRRLFLCDQAVFIDRNYSDTMIFKDIGHAIRCNNKKYMLQAELLKANRFSSDRCWSRFVI